MDDSNILSPMERTLFAVYLLWEVCNLIAIKYAELTCPVRIQCIVSFLAICANTLVTAYFYMKYGIKKRSRHNLLALGLFLTFGADFFLTLLNIRLPGFFAFCLVEMVYAIYYRPSKKYIFLNIMLRAVLFMASLGILYLSGYFDLANAFGMLNISLLSVNLIFAVCTWLHKKSSFRLCLALGFICFAGCDYSILIRTLARGRLYLFVNHMIWIFYIPAQVLLVLGYVLAIKTEDGPPPPWN